MSSEVHSEESESYNEDERRPPKSGRLVRLRKLNESRHVTRDDAPARVLRPKKQTFVAVDRSDDASEEEAAPERLLVKVLTPPVESVHSRKVEAGNRFYLVKMAGKALTKCVWMSEAELLERDASLKNKLKRFDTTFDAVAWDPQTESRCLGMDTEGTTVDRLLDSSDIFAMIHPKKASDLKSKWGDGLARVLRALVNFQVDQVYYGVFYLELGALYKHYPDFGDALDFAIVNNRVYLDFYQTPERFWDDLDLVYRSVERLATYLDEKSDVRQLNDRMRQLTARLYQEWADNVRLEAEVFAAKMTEDGFAESVEQARKEFEAAYESGTASPADVVTMFDRFQHVLKYPSHVGDRSFAEAAGLVRSMKEALGMTVEAPETTDKGFGEPPEPPLTATDEVERSPAPETNLEAAEAGMEVEHVEEPEQNGEETGPARAESLVPTPNPTPAMQVERSPHRQPAAPVTPHSLTPQEVATFITKIQTFVMDKLAFLDSVLGKVYWNDFLRQVHRLSPPPRHMASLSPIDWATDAQLATLGSNLETLYYVKWQGSSYADATWERESDLSDFEAKLRDFKRHTRAMDRESRKAYASRYEAFLELRRLTEEPRLMERVSNQQVTDLRQRIFAWKDPKGITQYTPKNQPIFKNERTLRSYQLESLNWMIDAWARRRNVILADEMGLGKTIQAMAFLNHLISFEHQMGPYLVIAPLSTLSHWKRTFEDWTHLNAILYYDAKGKAGREVCQQFEFNHWDITMRGLLVKDNNIPRFSILITSYEVFTQDFETVFRNLPFQHVIIDEAHKLKNKNAKIISILRRLVCQRFLLLTGTPIQNNMSELWSLLHFIEPAAFGDLPRFLAEFQTGQDMDSLTRLQDALRPYLLRRMKEDVESSIPPLTETIIDIELTSVQKMVYKTLYEKTKGTLQKGAGMAGISIMNNLEMQLRKCCNHPFTLADVADGLTRDCHSNEAYFDKLVSTSGKMIFLDKALAKFGREGKKVLIFSQFTEVLRLLEEYLGFKGIRYFKIDGSTKARDRQTSIDKFNSAQNEFEVFLLSTKAGGVGINLTSASVVVIFDSDWNPQNDIQAIARAHRIGQTNEVKVFRLISKKTYESEMFERASVKLGLDQAIILANNYVQKGPEAVGQDDFYRRKPEEIEMLLRKGAIGLITEPAEGAAEEGQFSQNIDDIIQNARTASYSVINKLYTFGKTKFVGDAKDELLQIDDPDFWKKAFANQKTTMDNFEREYQALAHADKARRLELQKSFFLRLSEEIYRYLNDRVTNEGYNADTEIRLSGLLIQIADNNLFHKVFRELAGQLNTDFNKSGRRIKKIDEKILNTMLKLDSTDVAVRRDANGTSGSRGSESEDERVATARRRRPAERRGVRSEDEASDESELFENEDEKAMIAFQKAKKALQEEKARICDFCGRNESVAACNGFCKRHFHPQCLQAHVAKLRGDSVVRMASMAGQPEGELRVVSPENVCVFCQTGKAVCFLCKEEGPQSHDTYLQANVGQSTDRKTLYKCSVCPKYYHPACMAHPVKPTAPPKPNGETDDKVAEVATPDFRCLQHFCCTCGAFFKGLYQCVECPFASHRKCMSKRNQILGNSKILCVRHIVKPEKPPKPVKERPPLLAPRHLSSRKIKPGQPEEPVSGKETERKVPVSPKTEKVKDRRPLRTNGAVSEPRPRSLGAPSDSNKAHKEALKVEESSLGKRARPPTAEKLERPSKAEKPSKKLKESAESNQKLAFSLYKPFDYSIYRKVT